MTVNKFKTSKSWFIP